MPFIPVCLLPPELLAAQESGSGQAEAGEEGISAGFGRGGGRDRLDDADVVNAIAVYVFS